MSNVRIKILHPTNTYIRANSALASLARVDAVIDITYLSSLLAADNIYAKDDCFRVALVTGKHQHICILVWSLLSGLRNILEMTEILQFDDHVFRVDGHD